MFKCSLFGKSCIEFFSNHLVSMQVCWKDVIHWMWPLFTENWGSWRDEDLHLSSCPFTVSYFFISFFSLHLIKLIYGNLFVLQKMSGPPCCKYVSLKKNMGHPYSNELRQVFCCCYCVDFRIRLQAFLLGMIGHKLLS